MGKKAEELVRELMLICFFCPDVRPTQNPSIAGRGRCDISDGRDDDGKCHRILFNLSLKGRHNSSTGGTLFFFSKTALSKHFIK